MSMGLGKVWLSFFGLKKKWVTINEKLIELGAMGLGYGSLMKGNEAEKVAVKDFLKTSSKKNLVIFDVGANKGQYIELLHEILGELDHEIHAFEPNISNCQKLEERYQGKKVKVVQCGLSNQEGELKLHNFKQDDLASFHYESTNPASYRHNKLKETFIVPITTTDLYSVNNGIEYIDFMKIDTEGHDFSVLEGSKKMIQEKRIGVLQFEFSEMNILSKTYFYDFWQLLNPNYQLFRILDDGIAPIDKYSTLKHEIFYPINFLAKARL